VVSVGVESTERSVSSLSDYCCCFVIASLFLQSFLSIVLMLCCLCVIRASHKVLVNFERCDGVDPGDLAEAFIYGKTKYTSEIVIRNAMQIC
jgi:hypothetical protein